jgi:hypothetical protein
MYYYCTQELDEVTQQLGAELEKALDALKNLGAVAEPFLHKVSKTLAPNYYEVINTNQPYHFTIVCDKFLVRDSVLTLQFSGTSWQIDGLFSAFSVLIWDLLVPNE